MMVFFCKDREGCREKKGLVHFCGIINLWGFFFGYSQFLALMVAASFFWFCINQEKIQRTAGNSSKKNLHKSA